MSGYNYNVGHQTHGARSEREWIRREMASYSWGGRYGDWMSWLIGAHPKGAAKVYKLMAESAFRRGHNDDGDDLMAEATHLWPEVVSWTGREPGWLAK